MYGLINEVTAWFVKKFGDKDQSFLRVMLFAEQFGGIENAIALGLIDGVEVRRASGFNPDIDDNQTEIIETLSRNDYPYPSVSDTFTFVSDNVADTMTWLVTFIDDNGLEQRKNIIQNGTTPVITSFTGKRINFVINTSDNSKNLGKITITHTISGDVLGEIPLSASGIGQNRLFSTVQSIPSNKLGLLVNANASITRISGGSGIREGQVQFRIRLPNGSFIPSNVAGLRSDGTTSLNAIIKFPLLILAGSDIEFTGEAFSNNTSMTATYTYLLIDKATFGLI